MTLEMGKPISQSEGEVLKCISHIDYSIDKSLEFMKDHLIPTRQLKSLITCEPVGPFLDIVPWNFPFWMPFKSMIPPFVLGNPILLKGSPSTPQCSEAIEKVFIDAGFNEGQFQNLFISNEQAANIIADKRVAGVKFTGSTNGGKQVAEVAGRHMK